MSIHVYDAWKLEDGADSFPRRAVAVAVAANGMRRPPVFAILTAGDRFAYYVGGMLEVKPAGEWSDGDVRTLLESARFYGEADRAVAAACIRQVLDSLVAGEHLRSLGDGAGGGR